MRLLLPSIKFSAAPPSFWLHRARGNQIVEHSSDNETVLGISQKPGEAPNIWLTIAKIKTILSVEL